MIRDLNINDFIYMLSAARWTLLLSVLAIAGGGVVGAGILAARLSRLKLVRAVAFGYIQFLQATPLLMQLFLVFFGGTLIGIRFDPWTAALIAFSLHASAFLGDIWYGSVEAVPRSQWEGAYSVALTRPKTFRLVIAPQALRIAIPPTVGFLVQLIKGTSLASIIGFVELVRAGQFINNSTLKPLFVYGFVACVFFVICWPLSKWSQSLEARLAKGNAR
ncbi:amino acid ABC transporter permease [Bosea sp. NBC_00550]|uniref:amino acid ABC transporter permease n=1 Tax=Bosea sp. NBC_00550 TaxID=2969621 RepID=UPI00222E0990|nr:amino acid ABC transporter permease [Bosea sp. NBC_00550]UZF95411.1 amino acid ABC transporter permease [Bosea sp. NBC_00550]